MIFASVSDPNSSMFSSSSRNRPLNDSTNGFSQGLAVAGLDVARLGAGEAAVVA